MSKGFTNDMGWACSRFSLFSFVVEDGLRTPNGDINQRNMKIWASLVNDLCYGKQNSSSMNTLPHRKVILLDVILHLHKGYKSISYEKTFCPVLNEFSGF